VSGSEPIDTNLQNQKALSKPDGAFFMRNSLADLSSGGQFAIENGPPLW
jgi:hypothetical protein